MVTGQSLEELERTIAPLSVDGALAELRSNGDVDEQRVHDLIELAAGRIQSDAVVAKQALDVGERLAVELQCLDAVPASMYLRARLHVNSGQPDEALDLIATARAKWLELDRPIDAYRTDLGRMHVLDDLGRHGEAVDVSDALLRDLSTIDAAGLNDEDLDQLAWIRAAADENLGVACGFTGQHQRALDAYRRAEEGYEKVGGLHDLARCRANSGVELVAIGRAVEGLEVLQSAAVMFEETDDRLSYAQCLADLADAELLLGLYAAALSRYEEARGLLDEQGAKSDGCRIRLRTVRAYLALNLVDEAAVLAVQTEESLRELGLQHDLAEARWLCAVSLFRAGRPSEALEPLALAAEGASTSDDPPLLIKALMTKSEILSELGDLAGAREATVDAIAVADSGDWPTEELHVQLRMAQLFDESDVVDGHLERAEQLADELHLPHLRYPVLLELGRHRRRQGSDQEARRWLEQAVAVVEGLRGLIPDEAVRTSYLEGRTAAHIDLMSMLLATGTPVDQQAAFDLAEASKARTLDDILAGVVQPDPNVDTSSSAVLQRYEADLNAAYSTLSTGGTGLDRERRRAIHDRAIELEQAIRLAHLQAKTKRAELDGDKAADRNVARPGRSEQVLEYHVLGDRIVAFVWVCGELHATYLEESTSQIAKRVALWDRRRQRFHLADHAGAATGDQLVHNAERSLRELWVAVVGPVAPLLDPDDENLLVIPHGPLLALPFHALIGPDGPVGEATTLTIAPSYAVAERLTELPADRSHGRSLVLGVPDEAAPAVEAEARFVAETLPGAELLLGPAATTDALFDRAQQPLDVLHLACHGLHRARNPMFSALKLGDRWLTARDVLGLRLTGTLVVLSACETGRHSGPDSQSEAIGLARSFLAAGASGVVVSLWLAGDDVTAGLMQHFYRELADGRSPAHSLRTAQTIVSKSHPHPSDWAPFVFHGGRGES